MLVSNFNLSLVFVSKIKLNFYKKMTQKMHDNLQKKYKNSVFQILKICKRLVILILIQQLGKKYTGLCNCLEISSQKGFR